MTAKVKYIGQLGTECTHLKSNTKINTDAPEDNAGRGDAFSPTDLLATSLAACIITVMGIRAQTDSIPFEHVEATIIKTMSDAPRKVGQVSIQVTIGDKWTDDQKEILENVGRRCPVALSLHPDLDQNISFEYV